MTGLAAGLFSGRLIGARARWRVAGGFGRLRFDGCWLLGAGGRQAGAEQGGGQPAQQPRRPGCWRGGHGCWRGGRGGWRLGLGARLGCRRRGLQRLHYCLARCRWGLTGRFQFERLGAHLGQFITGHRRFVENLVITDPLNIVLRCFHVHVRYDHQMGARATFDLGDVLAFLIQQIGGHAQRHQSAHHGAAFLQRLFFHHPQDRERQRASVTDTTLAAAARTDFRGQVVKRGSQTLAGHFEQTEARDPADLHPCAVGFERFAHLVFDGALISGARHVDEVDHDESADVAQT